jgi:hypothetical protein
MACRTQDRGDDVVEEELGGVGEAGVEVEGAFVLVEEDVVAPLGVRGGLVFGFGSGEGRGKTYVEGGLVGAGEEGGDGRGPADGEAGGFGEVEVAGELGEGEVGVAEAVEEEENVDGGFGWGGVK